MRNTLKLVTLISLSFLVLDVFSNQLTCNCNQNSGQIVIDNTFINCCKQNGIVKICGNFISTASKPAITISYDPNDNIELIIENSKIEGVASHSYVTTRRTNNVNISDLIAFDVPEFFQYNGSFKITIRNNIFNGDYTNIACKPSKPRVISIPYPKKFHFFNNQLNGTAGVNIAGWDHDFENSTTGKALLSTTDIKIKYNKFKNVDGRVSNGQNGYYNKRDNPTCINNVSAISVSAVNSISGVEMAWNEIINEPNNSLVEDAINFYNSSGKENSPINFHDNYLQGAYPYPADQLAQYSGGGVNLSDGCNGLLNRYAFDNSFLKAYNNHVVSMVSYGIAINSGHNNEIYNNRLISINSRTVAISVSPWFYVTYANCVCPDINGNDPICGPGGTAAGVTPPEVIGTSSCNRGDGNNKYYDLINFYGHKISNNYIKWSTILAEDNSGTSSCSNCGINEKYISTTGLYCINSTKYNYRCGVNGNTCEEAISEDEKNEYLLWLKKLKDNNITVGVIPNGSDVLTRQVPTGTQQNQTFSAYNEVSAVNGTTMLPGVTMQLSDFSFTACLTNNNPSLPVARVESIDNSALNNKNDSTKYSLNSDYKLYPNPSNGELNIEAKNNEISQLNISLINGLGTDIFTSKVIEKMGGVFSINLNTLADGIYFIKINDNAISKNLKFILQK